MSICIQANDKIITLLKLDCMVADKGHRKYCVRNNIEKWTKSVYFPQPPTYFVAAPRWLCWGPFIWHVPVRFFESHSYLAGVTAVELRRHILNVKMTSSNGNLFRATGPLCAEFTDHRWIPLTNASYTELWWFLWPVPEQTVEWTTVMPVMSDAIALIMTSM